MASPNLNLRDPVMYRILHAEHHRTGDEWCIYPMYDWAHGLEDSIEGITHSICTLEFEDHRPLYDWFLEQLGVYRPQQIEFARLNLTLHRDEQAQAAPAGAGGPRRRLGRPAHADHLRPAPPRLHRRARSATSATASAWRKRDSTVDFALLEHCLREDLNQSRAARDGGAATR